MSRNKVEFVKAEESPATTSHKNQEGAKYQDFTFEEGFADLKLKFEQKLTWFRIIPPISGTKFPHWLLNFEVYKAPEGQNHPTFVNPASLGQPSVWEQAKAWFLKNARERLANRETNPNGFKLRSTPRGIAWVIAGEGDNQYLKLLTASTYDGKFGGTTGLGYEIAKAAEVKDNEPGSPTIGQLIHGDITDPTKGRLVCVEKSTPEAGDTKFASYSARIGKADAPLQPLLDKLSDSEFDKMVPLEKVLYLPTEQEQHAYLRGYIGDEWYKKIFG
jgi:hypothetical protein